MFASDDPGKATGFFPKVLFREGRFKHNPDQRLCSRSADKDPAVLPQFTAECIDRCSDDRILQPALLGGNGQIVEHLGNSPQPARQLGKGKAGAGDNREKPQRCQQPIAGGAVIGKNNMARLLTAQVIAAGEHLFENISIPHGGADKSETMLLRQKIEASVAHYRGHERAVFKGTLLHLIDGADRHDRIPVDSGASHPQR